MIRTFILPKRQRRYLELLSKPERRPDVTRELAHFKHLDMRFAVPIPPSHGGLDRTLSILKSKGAEDICYVISENDELDGKEMALKGAVCAILGRGIGTFLTCTKGTLGYFERKGKS